MTGLDDSVRVRFHLPDGHYFLSHSVGLMPTGIAEGLSDAVLAPWQAQGQSWDEWLAVIDRFRCGLGAFLNTDPAMICPQTNVSSALTKILFSLPEPGKRNTILLSEQDFPTIGFVALQAERLGWHLRYLPREADLTDATVWLDAMGEDVGIVLVTHAYSNSAMLAPVAAITDAARTRGIVSTVDIAQSAGTIAIDIAAWQADFVIGTSVKYLCGGPGAAFLWASPQIIAKCQPLDVGWFSHENPFEFDLKDFRYAPDARRFWGGTPSVLPYAMAAQSIETLTEIGIGTIHRQNQQRLGRLIDGLDPAMLKSETREGRRGSHLLYAPPDVEAATKRLEETGIRHDCRAGALRLSVHLYITEEDIDAALAALTG
ncbi:aminotransferase class V-fold PLP-dependent enzyme [Parvularcula flava]|uniref:Aminotransferase class V-fold PLP-dependent enzyme n=1 Tax=Aquisalinus luteolus TaxID=1566827 RepID=A0A8J3EPJ9_9PROT|nr:aminotransferase class V-fold PLP-dependent enzyme [Aquisalinus luteolus]NHK28361.1 aminotransferase class V-fold PLP-dependent enzyme [Aquisalinus luteolus]GGH98244.1 class V aminotransferase [Aquisalinus luteolus]